MAARRDLSIAEIEVIAELATAAPDLVAVKDQLLGALAAPGGSHSGGRLAWTPALEPKTWGQLMEAVRLGIIQPKEAKRFLNIPQGEPGVLARLARLRWQRGAM
ncbi:MAG: hypothetical protein ACYCS9_04510 [Candidatus Dormibacteria bacterium]